MIILTEDETESISKRSLAPDQTLGVNSLSGTIDVTPADPGCRHGEDSDEKPDRTTGQHDLLLGVVAGLLFPGGPYSHAQDQEVEQDDGDDPSDVNHLWGGEIHWRELELTKTEVREVRYAI